MASLELKQEIQEALKNQTLSRTLGTFCATYPAKREKSYAGVDFESTRDSIKEVKSYAADHIDEMIDDFTKNCTARGGHVFHAKSGEEAMEYIRNLVKEKGVKTIVKSKSMASEEIHMNHILHFQASCMHIPTMNIRAVCLQPLCGTSSIHPRTLNICLCCLVRSLLIRLCLH